MDPWEMFSELCKRVVEDQNVYLEVVWLPNQVHFSLFPMDEGSLKMINFFIGVLVGATVGYIVAAVMHVASKGGENE